MILATSEIEAVMLCTRLRSGPNGQDEMVARIAKRQWEMDFAKLIHRNDNGVRYMRWPEYPSV